MWVTTLWDHTMVPVQWAVAVGAALAAAVFDAATRRIPNILTGVVLVAGFVWAGWVGGLAGLADAAAACLILAGPYVLLFLLASGGAGDAKMMGALGAWLGVINAVAVLLGVALSGVVLALVFALARGRLRQTLANMAAWVRLILVHLASRGRLREVPVEPPQAQAMQKMPYGLAIFAGTCLAGVGVWLWRA